VTMDFLTRKEGAAVASESMFGPKLGNVSVE
jgi:hypothetical protein